MTARPLEADDDLVAELLEDLTNRVQAGEAIDVETVARAHPACADRLRRLLPAMQALAALDRSADEPAPGFGPLTGTLGDFRIVREIGRGGMGIVYEAEQISLARRVALKVLPLVGMLDARQLQRFQNEARAAACLHHSNIVPVHFVGSDRGVHYYAMQFIEGRTLADLIAAKRPEEDFEDRGSRIADRGSRGEEVKGTVEERAAATAPVTSGPASSILDPRSSIFNPRSSYFRTVARLGAQAAAALDHAHQQGIVHRDVKPANLMLDGDGRLWVTDFGLAHVQGDGGLTVSGDVIGTLRYMSPEQALGRGRLVDHRTDVYSLGVTLYELLTLQPAFCGDDRHELLDRIAREEPPPVRRLNPAIPVELETIVAKAMAKGREERYATAQELAEDLERFLEDRPILARRPGLPQRLRKWARRHRPLVVSLGLSAALLLIGAVVGLASYAVEQGELAKERAQIAREKEEARQRTGKKLYAALLRTASAARREGKPGYRRQVWADLKEAQQEAASLGIEAQAARAIRAELLACLGDPIGQDPANPARAVRKVRAAAPAPFRKWLPPFPGAKRAPSWAFAPNGEWFVRGTDPAGGHGLSVWDKTARLRFGIPPVLGGVYDLQFTPDGRLLVAGCEEGVACWIVPTFNVRTCFHAGNVTSIDVHPGGRLLATAGRGDLELWSLSSHRLVAKFPAPAQGCRVEFSADGKLLLAVLAGKAIAAWPVGDTAEKWPLHGHWAGVPALAFAPDGRTLATGSKDGSVRLWDAAMGRPLHVLHPHSSQIEAVAFSPDGRLLATGDVQGEVCLWDVASGKRLDQGGNFTGPCGQVWRLQFAPTGSRLFAAGGKGVVAWEVRVQGKAVTMEFAAVAQFPDGKVFGTWDLAVHPNGAEVVFAKTDGCLYVWDLRREAAPRPLDAPAAVALRGLAFDRAGAFCTFVTTRGTLGVCDWRRKTVRDTGQKAFQVALNPSGDRFATVSPSQGIVLCDVKSGKEVLRLPPEGSDVWAVAWASDDRRLAAGLADGGVVVWDLVEVRARLQEFGLVAP